MNTNIFSTHLEFSKGVASVFKVIDTIHNISKNNNFNNRLTQDFIIDTILSILWEDPNENEIFSSMIEDGETITNKNLSAQTKEGLLLNSNSFGLKFKYYNNAFRSWIDNYNPTSIDDVVYRFKDVNSICENNINEFKVKNYEVTVLPIYMQIANLHLLLLRDGMIYGDAWNLYRELGFSDQDSFYNHVLDKTKFYINDCLNYYNTGLSNLKLDPNNSWIDITRYCRFMTFYILDMISIFPIYDTKVYDKPINMQTLTRKVYSDPVNFIDENIPISEYEKMYNISPELFSTLFSISFYTNKSGNKFLNGHVNRHVGTDLNYNGLRETHYGNYGSNYEVESMAFDDIKAIQTTTFFNTQNNNPTSVKSIKFLITKNNDEWIYGEPDSSNIDFTRNIQGYLSNLNNESYTHSLSDMILANNDKIQINIDTPHSYSYSWIYKGIEDTNYISDKLINQIPLVKGSKIESSEHYSEISVIKGPGFTGGDLILSKVHKPANQIPAQYMKNKITIPIKTKFPAGSQDFKVRLCYASNHDIGLIRLIAGSKYITTNIQQTFNTTENNPSLIYDDFKYFNFNETLSITSSGIDELYLEFYYSYTDGNFEDFPKLSIPYTLEIIPVNL